MKKKSALILFGMSFILALLYVVVDIQYKPDLTAFSQKNEICTIEATLGDILPQDTVQAQNPLGKKKELQFLNASGEVIDLNTPIIDFIEPDRIQQFMSRLSTSLDSKPLVFKFYIRPIYKLEPVEIVQTISYKDVDVEPIVMNFKTDLIPKHYLLSYKGKELNGPINPWAETDQFKLFKIVGQDFIRKDSNNVYYIDIQNKEVFKPAQVQKAVLKSDGDQPDEFCGDMLDDAFNNIPLRYRYFALQHGLSVRWKDMLKMTDEDIRLHNGSYKEDTVKSARDYSDTIVAYYDNSIKAIEFNNKQGFRTNFSKLFNRSDWYYTIEGDSWNKPKDIYTVAELKKYAIGEMKSNFAHEFGHFIDDNLPSYYVSETELKKMRKELPYHYDGMYREEVLAAAFEVYFTEQNRMKKQAPTSYEVCEELLAKLDMTIPDTLLEISKGN